MGVVRRLVKNAPISNADYDGNLDFFNGPVTGTFEINNGILTLTPNAHGSAYGRYLVNTQGSASTDNLDTVNGTQVGDLIELRCVNASRVITLRHVIGNLRLSGGLSFTLNSLGDSIWLRNLNGSVLVAVAQNNVPDV